MYSSKLHIAQLTALLREWGIRRVVTCPGSRNVPLVHNFHEAGMECYDVTDERSAGFFALGLIQAYGGEPVAVCCTSGTAGLNLAPAMAEAYYQPLPLIAITADRPLAWIGQMDGQTLHQNKIFAGFVRDEMSLVECESEDSDDYWYNNRRLNELMMTLAKYRGPVHINVPTMEPLFDFSMAELPHGRKMERCCRSDRFDLTPSMKAQIEQSRHPLLLIGQMLPEQVARLKAPLSKLPSQWTIWAEYLSNVQILGLDGKIVRNFQDLERDVVPDLVVTIGGHLISKELKQWLRKSRPIHWQISETGEVADLFQCESLLVEASPHAVLQELACGSRKSSSLTFHLSSLDSHPSWLHTLVGRLSPEWAVHVANSSLVRLLQKVEGLHNPVYCNRGVNGIDGSLSTAAGYAQGGKPTLFLTGDLGFFYDQNGLWNKYMQGKAGDACLRIMLYNDGGGQIFSHLPGLQDSPYWRESVSGLHQTSAQGIAVENHCGYLQITEADDMECAFRWLLEKDASENVRILEYKA